MLSKSQGSSDNNYKKTKYKKTLTFYTTATSVLFLTLTLCVGQLSANTQWKKVSSKDNIQIYTLQLPDSDIKGFKGVMTLESTPQQVFDVLSDTKNFNQWLRFVDSMELISKQTPLIHQYFVTQDFPWPSQDREAAIKLSARMDETGGLFVQISQIENTSKMTRNHPPLNDLYGYFKLKWLTETKSEIEFCLYADPGKDVPSWIVNLMIRDTPFYTLKGLKNQILSTKKNQRPAAFMGIPVAALMREHKNK